MRTQKALKNIVTAVGSYLLLLVLGLVVRRLLLHRFDTELVGYDSLLSNIFTWISVADLGVQGSFSYRLYQAFAANDRDRISKLLGMYRKLFLTMGAAVGLVCAGLFFCLPAIFSGKVNFWGYFRLMYILYSVTAVTSYVFGYWGTLLVAGQLQYKAVRIETGIQVANLFAKALILWTVRSYFLYSVFNTAFALAGRVWITLSAKKEYSDIKPAAVSWSDFCTEGFTEEIRNLLPIKIAGAVNGATDSFLITMLINATTTGLYSNYTLIGSSVSYGFHKVLFPLQASVADLIYKDSSDTKDNTLKFYNTLHLVCFFLAAAVLTGFVMVFQNAIGVFFGARYRLSMSFVLAYAVIGYQNIQPLTDAIFRGCFGDFQIDRRFSAAGAAVNLAASVIFLRIWGVTGALLGTVLASLFNWCGNIMIVEKNLFERSLLRRWCTEAAYFLLACAEAALTWLLLKNVRYSFLNMWLLSLGSVLIPTACNLAIFRRTPAFQDILYRARLILTKFVEKKR